MALDPRLILAAGENNPINALAQGLQQGVQTYGNIKQIQQRQQSLDQDAALNPLRQQVLEQQAQGSKLENAVKQHQLIGQLLPQAVDEPSYQSTLKQAMGLGVDISGLPPTYRPEILDTLKNSWKSNDDRLKEAQINYYNARSDKTVYDTSHPKVALGTQSIFANDPTVPKTNNSMPDVNAIAAALPAGAMDMSVPDQLKQPPSTLNQPAKTGDEFLKSLKPDIAATVKLIGDGKIKPETVLSRMKATDKTQILNAVAQYNPEFSGTNFGNIQKFETGKQGDSVRSLNVATAHLETLSQAADALNNGDMKIFNSIANTIASQTGQPAPNNFDTTRNLVAGEVTKAIVGAGGTGEDREQARNIIASANSPAQLKGAIGQVTELMNGQLAGLKNQYEAGTGKKDFDTKFRMRNNSNVVQIKGDDDYNSLPSGTAFIDPDGKRRVKP